MLLFWILQTRKVLRLCRKYGTVAYTSTRSYVKRHPRQLNIQFSMSNSPSIVRFVDNVITFRITLYVIVAHSLTSYCTCLFLWLWVCLYSCDNHKMNEYVRRALEMNSSFQLSKMRDFSLVTHSSGGEARHCRDLQHRKQKVRIRCDSRPVAEELFHRVDHASRLFREQQTCCIYYRTRHALPFKEKVVS